MHVQSADVNFRAFRDMGLAAWWGGTLGGLAGLARAADKMPDAQQRFRVLDAGMKGSRGFTGAGISAYVIGTQLVRFHGKIVGSNGLPKWISEGPESPYRTALTALGVCSAVAAKTVRAKAGKELEERHGRSSDAFEKWYRSQHTLQVVAAACAGALMYSHLKEEATR
jgi:hypothetical protein